MNEHELVINKMLKEREYEKILDLGSGKTSLGTLLKSFQKSEINAVCYPGDERKTKSIKENCKGNYNLYEMDICKEQPKEKYDLVMCHLLLGEALKFNNTLEDMLNGILKIDAKEVCIIDYFEDIDIDFKLVRKIFKSNGYNIVKEIIYKKEKNEKYDKFIGENYIGLLFKK